MPGPDQEAFYGKLKAVMDVTHEAFHDCASKSFRLHLLRRKDGQGLCDAIFKYAVDVLIDDQEKKLGTQVRDAILGQIPILTPAADAASKTVGLIGDADDGVCPKQTTDIVQSLMQLGNDFGGDRWQDHASLSRCAIEMETAWSPVDWLASRNCESETQRFVI